jgi:hypothetical protein
MQIKDVSVEPFDDGDYRITATGTAALFDFLPTPEEVIEFAFLDDDLSSLTWDEQETVIRVDGTFHREWIVRAPNPTVHA